MKKETIEVGPITMDFLLETTNIGDAATMFAFTVPAGAKVPVTYYREHFEETIYGIERIITFTVEGKAMDLAPNETSFIPRGAVHRS